MDLDPNYFCVRDYPQETCKVSLQGEELWKKFHARETEMIITKTGRRMFPSMRITISGLEPSAHYCLLLEFAPATNCRYRYSTATGWTPAGSGETRSLNRVYLHPESPATGEHWTSQPVSFGRTKLTNTPAPPTGHVVLSSMHKYQPRIIIVKSTDITTMGCSPSITVVFPETRFIAVTAYQNEEITKLKIDNNPFAKGFRENGQSKCKRKERAKEEFPKQRRESIRIETSEHASPPDNQQSSPTFPSLVNTALEEQITKAAVTCCPNLYSPYSFHYPHIPPHYYTLQPYCFPSNVVSRAFWSDVPDLHTISSSPSRDTVGVPESQEPKKLTDFSIRAITGL